MGAGADNRRLGFERARHVQHILPQCLVAPALVEVAEHPPHTFDSKHPDIREARLLELRMQVFGAVEVRRRERGGCSLAVSLMAR